MISTLLATNLYLPPANALNLNRPKIPILTTQFGVLPTIKEKGFEKTWRKEEKMKKICILFSHEVFYNLTWPIRNSVTLKFLRIKVHVL